MTKMRHPWTAPIPTRPALYDLRTWAEMPCNAAVQPCLRDLFLSRYPEFADRLRGIEAPGLAVVAVHEASGQLAGVHCLVARASVPNVAILGRHSQADLSLAFDRALSLRHLAIILDPVTRWDAGQVDLRYRVLDLQSRAGFVDETGRGLRAVRCESAAILRVSGYAIYCLPVGDPSDWPRRPEDAWAFLPERVYFDELPRCAEGSRPIHLRRHRDGVSRVCRTLEPVTLGQEVMSAHGCAVARLSVTGPCGERGVDISASALERGVLIGRYARCSVGTALFDDSVSRVHLLIARSGDSVYAIDTCSTNATFSMGSGADRALRSVRQFDLTHARTLQLGKGESQLRWQWLV